MATQENKMHIERENLSVLAKVAQVSDVAHWPLVNYSQCIINAFLIIRQNVHAI
jgi:hypothetical protein